MPLKPKAAISSIARWSFPPQVIAAYPTLISAGAPEMGVSKSDRSIGGYNGSKGGNAAAGIAQLPARAVSPAMNSLRDAFQFMEERLTFLQSSSPRNLFAQSECYFGAHIDRKSVV